MHALTLAANLNEHKLSYGEIGFKFTIINTFEVSLPSCCYNMRVNLEFLKGTCFFSFIADITSPSALKLLFIASVSFRRSPSTLELLRRSEPAKSTKLKTWLRPSLLTHFSWKIEWLRDERSLHAVSATTLFFSAYLSSWYTLLGSFTHTHVGSYLLCCAFEFKILFASSKSRTESKYTS